MGAVHPMQRVVRAIFQRGDPRRIANLKVSSLPLLAFWRFGG
jgi:hypothetical protein